MGPTYEIRAVVTTKFYSHHVVLIDALFAGRLSRRDLEQEAKDNAERMYQARGETISSLLVLGRGDIDMLQSEVRALQSQYQAAFNAQYKDRPPTKFPAEVRAPFMTNGQYAHFSRGTVGAAPAKKKRAEFQGLIRFKYMVAKVQSEHGEEFKIDHYPLQN